MIKMVRGEDPKWYNYRVNLVGLGFHGALWMEFREDNMFRCVCFTEHDGTNLGYTPLKDQHMILTLPLKNIDRPSLIHCLEEVLRVNSLKRKENNKEILDPDLPYYTNNSW